MGPLGGPLLALKQAPLQTHWEPLPGAAAKHTYFFSREDFKREAV